MKALIAEVDNSTFESKLLALDATKETDYALEKIARKKHQNDLAHLEKVFQANEMTTDINPAPRKIHGPAIKNVTPQEIKFAIDKLNPRKAARHLE